MPSTDMERKLQGCDVCGQVDTHPRHVTLFPQDQEGVAASAEVARKAIEAGIGPWSLQDLLSPARAVRHFDCCAELGCETCRDALSAANNAHGDDLVRELTKGG